MKVSYYRTPLKQNVLILLVLSFFSSFLHAQTSPAKIYDLVIVGGTPAGITAAITGSKSGKNCVIIERSEHIGGLVTSGLGATDLKTKGAVGGLFKVFIDKVLSYYKTTYGNFSSQARQSNQGYHFEPSVAEKVLDTMVNSYPNITILKSHQFDSDTDNIVIKNNRIECISVLNRTSGAIMQIRGKVFIDATYEGDLIAVAGEPFKVGRESSNLYNEKYAGKIYKYWGGPVGKGSTLTSDTAIQAFNYRLCLTKNPNNQTKIIKPENYNREEYISLVTDVTSGKHTGVKYLKYLEKQTPGTQDAMLANTNSKPKVPGAPQGINRLVNLTDLPNDKTDANNQQLAFISTDLPEENWNWPVDSWEKRDQFAERLKNYTLGLLYFAQNDEALPDWFREDCLQWGLASDEFINNNNFPRQVYVREGRRMQSTYIFTANDALPVKEGYRPPLHSNSISAGHYSIDSHGVKKREPNRVNLDGFISYKTQPFTIPYSIITPNSVTNLLAPVPVSASHLGFSAIRLEPTWMALGEAAGQAAVLSINNATSVQDISVNQLQANLLNQDAVLLYYKDLSPKDKHYKAMQFLGVKGIFSDWKARPNKLMTKEEIIKACETLNISPAPYLNRIKRKTFAMKVYKDLFE